MLYHIIYYFIVYFYYLLYNILYVLLSYIYLSHYILELLGGYLSVARKHYQKLLGSFSGTIIKTCRNYWENCLEL